MSRANIVDMISKARTNNGLGFRASTYATDYIYQGKAYSIRRRFTVAAATNLIMLFDMTGISPDKTVTLYSPVLDATTGPIHVDYYIGADYAINSATEITPNNRAYYGQASQVQFSYGPLTAYTGTTKGVLFTEDLVNAGHKTGGGSLESLEFVPVQRQKILVEFDNTNGSDATMTAQIIWFEV